MAEVCTPPFITYDEDGDELVSFGEVHSVADICRWLISMGCGDEARDMLSDMLTGAWGAQQH